MNISLRQIETVKNLGATLSTVSDLDKILESVLTQARRFVGAEAGSIYVREDGRPFGGAGAGYRHEADRLILRYAQNDSFDERNQRKLATYINQELTVTANSMASFVLRTGTVLNVPDAYTIAEDKPYRFKSHLDKKTGYVTRSSLSLPLKDIRGKVIGVLQLINRRDASGEIVPFTQGDEEMMLLFSTTAALALERTQLIQYTVLRTLKMVELRDTQETVQHAQRVGHLAALLYREWAMRRALPPAEIRENSEMVRIAAMLHDVGKVGVADSVLNKPGRLAPDERLEMQRHVLIGTELFCPSKNPLDAIISEVVLNHHERWDGRGYPGWVDPITGLPLPERRAEDGQARGKKGPEISLASRATGLADVFDALSSTRAYKEAFDEDLVCQILLQESGHHFDPELVDILLTNLDKARAIRETFSD